MSRPKPTILAECSDQKLHRLDQILAADAIWAVFYKSAPFNLKSVSLYKRTLPKYKKVSFSNRGHAENLAKKLNRTFNTTDFTVVKFSVGAASESGK